MKRYIAIKILNVLAKKIVAKHKPIIIGITGSVGKSSARKAIYDVLKSRHSVICNKSDYRSDISIPLSIIGEKSGGRSALRWLKIVLKAVKLLLDYEKYPEIVILEMDVNKPGDMKNILKVVKPNIGIFTGVGKYPSHLEYFRDPRQIAKEKALLIKSLGKKDAAIINYDDEYAKELVEAAKSEIITYGFDPAAKYFAEEIFLGDRKWRIENGSIGMSFKISQNGTTVPFRLPYALGRAQMYAALAACATASRFGYNLLEISEILSKYQPLNGRMKLIKGINKSVIIDDTFNANPSSMLAALESLGKLDAPKRVAVLGDMMELGKYANEGHLEVGKKISKNADTLLTFGKKSKIIYEKAKSCGMAGNNARHFESKKELAKELKKIIKGREVILVKGSRSMHMEEIVKEIMERPELADELLIK